MTKVQHSCVGPSRLMMLRRGLWMPYWCLIDVLVIQADFGCLSIDGLSKRPTKIRRRRGPTFQLKRTDSIKIVNELLCLLIGFS